MRSVGANAERQSWMPDAKRWGWWWCWVPMPHAYAARCSWWVLMLTPNADAGRKSDIECSYKALTRRNEILALSHGVLQRLEVLKQAIDQSIAPNKWHQTKSTQIDPSRIESMCQLTRQSTNRSINQSNDQPDQSHWSKQWSPSKPYVGQPTTKLMNR